MSTSPNIPTQSDPLPPQVPLTWSALLHVSPLVASIRMSIDMGRPVTVRQATIELERARRRQERELRRQNLHAEETRDNLKADGLGRKLKGTDGTTMLYKLIVQAHLRPDRAELLAEAYS
jgi:hypothetical protein